MVLDKNTIELIFEIEYLIGKECYNPHSYDGDGCEYRFPVSIEDNELVPTKVYCNMASSSSFNKPEIVHLMRYKFGANHLYIGDALVNVLSMLEERYGISFNELEALRKEKLDNQ